MSLQVCHLCGICPGHVSAEFASILPFPICSRCINQSYGGNERRAGSPSHLPSFSVEFEIQGSFYGKRNDALVLLALGYLRTSDGTVDDEYKSPIYHRYSHFRPHLPVLDTLKNLVTDDCGTHLHVSMPAHLKQRLNMIHNEVFGPLIDHLLCNEDETEQFWGRIPCYYATSFLYDSFACIRVSGRYDTLEFRLPRFRSAAQYLAVVQFCRRVTYYLHRSLSAEVTSATQMGIEVLNLYRDSVKRSARLERKGTKQRIDSSAVPSLVNTLLLTL